MSVSFTRFRLLMRFLYLNFKDILSEPNQILFGECGENATSMDATCKTPIIASMTPKCILHLSNASGVFTNGELSQMNRVNEASFSQILAKTAPEHPPKHLQRLANAYKQILNRMYEEEKQAVQDHHEKLISTIIEEEGIMDSDLPNSLSIFEQSSLIRIKQEILETNNPHQLEDDASMLMLDSLTSANLGLNSPTMEPMTDSNENQPNLGEDGKKNELIATKSSGVDHKSDSDTDSDDDDESTSSDSSTSSSNSSSSSSTSNTSSSNSNSRTSDSTDTSSDDSSDSETESVSESTASTRIEPKPTEGPALEKIVEHLEPKIDETESDNVVVKEAEATMPDNIEIDKEESEAK